jgi:sorbitol-specific phosphotransferase system component IIBC
VFLFQKQLAQYTKVISHVWDIANKAREEWESEAGSRTTQAQTSSTADTHALVAAVGMGKGLKVSFSKGKSLIFIKIANIILSMYLVNLICLCVYVLYP